MCYLDGGLHLHVCACSDDDGDQVEISIFRKYRNKLNHLIEKSKVNYYMQQIASSNNNSSLMWKTIKNILNKGHKKQIHLQDLQNEDSTLTKSSKESADKINLFFCTWKDTS